MKFRTTTVLFLSAIACTPLYSMDTDDENTFLIDSDSDDSVSNEMTIVPVKTKTLHNAYDDGFRTHEKNKAFSVQHYGLTSCAITPEVEPLLQCGLIEVFDISNNKLSAIDDSVFSAMPNLTKLNVSGNLITQSLTLKAQHTKLKTLCMHSNKLTDCPLEALLTTLPNLKQLTLDDNPITNYGIMHKHHASLEEIWIEHTASDEQKKMIVVHCPSLTARICEDDELVQKIGSKRKISRKKCITGYSVLNCTLIVACGLIGIVTPFVKKWLCADGSCPNYANFTQELENSSVDHTSALAKELAISGGISAAYGLVAGSCGHIALYLWQPHLYTKPINPIARYPKILLDQTTS